MNGKQIVMTEQANIPTPYENGSSLAVSLARAEVDQQITTARAYPRSISRAVEHTLTLATLDEKTAAVCIYALPRKDEFGQQKLIKGPSIRLAEIVASQWGNCRVGARVVHVDRYEKYVEAEGVFHDLETNMATTSRIRRSISTKKGGVFREDMIVMAGNAACAIAKRNAIFAGVPRGVWGRAYDAVEHVIAGDVKTLVARRRGAISTMASEYGITADRIFTALGIVGEDDIDLEALSTLTAMRASLKNGEATLDELFPMPAPKNGAPKGLDAKLDAIAAGGNGVYDPETGEIKSVITDVVEDRGLVTTTREFPSIPGEPEPGEEAARQVAAKLEERAVNNGVTNYDEKLAELLDRARAMATNGLRKFNQWELKLNGPDSTRLGPHLEGLRKAAAAADGGGA